MGYAKLFSSITESSLWSEPKETRILFVSMLARADAVGFVEASVPGLSRLANISEEETIASLASLEGPDRNSKNQDNDGRRILKVDGGWMIINYEHYRNRRSDEERREYLKEYMREYRKKHSVNNRKQSVNIVNPGKPRLTQAEATAEAEASSKFRSLGSATRKPGRKPGERAALEKLGALIGPSNMTNYGGLWRIRYREDPGKFERVVVDLASSIADGVVEAPGGYADDLWKRFK